MNYRVSYSIVRILKQRACLCSIRNYGVLLGVLCLSMIAPGQLHAQATIIIDKIPEYTPKGDSLYIVGSFNDWNPGDARYLLKKNSDSTYSITMPKDLDNFKYKITRGSWPTVEGDINGKQTSDRVMSVTKAVPSTHHIEIVSWEDMALYYSWNIIVKGVPDNTPFDASVFISGSFNDWKDNDPQYRLTKFNDGTYGVKIPKAARDTIWFKFHRGTWASVESRANGRTQFNRLAAWDQSKFSTNVVCEIEGWEDITVGSTFAFSFILVACVLQALVLIVSLFAVRKRNTRITGVLILLLMITAITLAARLSTYNRFMFELQPKLLLLSDISYFLYAPVFYLLITRIAGVSILSKNFKWVLILPAIIYFLFYVRLAFIERNQFVLNNIDGKFDMVFDYASLAGLIYNVVMWVICLRLVLEKQRSVKNYGYQPSYSYLMTLFFHLALILLIWFVAVTIFASGKFFGYNVRQVHEDIIDVVWIVFALTTYAHTFLVVRKPELFKIKEEVVEDKQKGPHQKENIETLKTTLAAIMKKQRPYLNSKITLQELADLMKINVHTLSWVINEGHNKNFFDFINEHRIEEFKRLVNSDQYKNYTFLAVAMEVGFSSKTTFNRAFKKSTGKTPREFFNNVQESQLEGIGD
jgi:AraC-like DNA-binding protein